MSSNKLHIISLDIPHPPDYGGAIDIFYRIKALHTLGVEITLHCFESGRSEQKELEKYASNVYYYKRNKSFFNLLSRKPFIVKSRSSYELLKRLLKDNSPILFEGLHTTFYLDDQRIKSRQKLVRTHNVEHDYYLALAKKAKGIKKFYFQQEARKLKKYERVLKSASHILAIQKKDEAYFNSIHESVHLLPASIPELNEVSSNETKSQILFHGNLSVLENESAAIWLLNNVFPQLAPKKVFIAGKNPSQKLIDQCQVAGVNIIPNPDKALMDLLIQESRIHVLYTEQSTGLKLKLLQSLQSIGHVIANHLVLEGSGLEGLCSIANSPSEFKEQIDRLIQTSASTKELEARKVILLSLYDNKENCRIILKLISN